MRNLVFKIAVFKHFAEMRVFRFFERVGISKGCKYMKMSRKCSYCYKVIVSCTKIVFGSLCGKYAHKIDYAHFGMKCAKWSGMYPYYHIRSYKPF